MIDRVSVFGDARVVELLKESFVCVAIDQWYQRRQKDAEGEFYRKIMKQGPRHNFAKTTQGLYVADADGKLLGAAFSHHATNILKMLGKARRDFVPRTVPPISEPVIDPVFAREVPKRALVARVHAKVLGGYPKGGRWFHRYFRGAISRDNLWITEKDQVALCSGEFPPALARRIARFHLVDDTRGEPTMWRTREIRALDLRVDANGEIRGRAHLETKDGKRGFQCALRGKLRQQSGKIDRFDLVAKGEHWGDGRWTRGAPPGRFPLAIAFRLADGTEAADRVAPQGTKGWQRDYVE